MSSCDHNICFKGINSISEDLLLNILESNFKMYFDWAFLNIGAWIDATANTYNIYNVNQPARLLPVSDPSYKDGQVWQGIRKDWVWEQNIVHNNSSPITTTSAPTINGSPPAINFTINYPLGRIIFDSPLPLSSNVQMPHSYRFVQVNRSADSPWFNLLQYGSFNSANPDIKRSEDGEWSIGGNHRIQMPSIIVEALPKSRSRPYEIGNTLLWLEQDIAFYVYAENKNDRNKLLDIIRLQQDATLQLYNTNALAQDDAYPLDHNGQLKTNGLMYPEIINNYAWRKCFIKNINLFEIESVHPGFHQGMARATLEIIST